MTVQSPRLFSSSVPSWPQSAGGSTEGLSRFGALLDPIASRLDPDALQTARPLVEHCPDAAPVDFGRARFLDGMRIARALARENGWTGALPPPLRPGRRLRHAALLVSVSTLVLFGGLAFVVPQSNWLLVVLLMGSVKFILAPLLLIAGHVIERMAAGRLDRGASTLADPDPADPEKAAFFERWKRRHGQRADLVRAAAWSMPMMAAVGVVVGPRFAADANGAVFVGLFLIECVVVFEAGLALTRRSRHLDRLANSISSLADPLPETDHEARAARTASASSSALAPDSDSDSDPDSDKGSASSTTAGSVNEPLNDQPDWDAEIELPRRLAAF